jgi:hypothetical protein
MRFGAGVRARAIPVSGPAIARVFNVEASDDWISVTREGDDLHVAVSPRYGAEGWITLRCAAGTMPIRVIAEGRRQTSRT